MKKSFKNALIYIIFIGIIIFATATLLSETSNKDVVEYSDVKQYFFDGKVKRFVIDDENVLQMEIVDPSLGKDGVKTVTYQLRSLDLFYNDLKDVIDEQQKSGDLESYDYPAPKTLPMWVSFIPYILIIVVIIALWVFFMRQATGGKGSRISSVGKAKAKLVNPDKTKVFFKDVAGADEEKAELEEIVEFLRDPAYFTKLGAKIPHGVLLMGPPGTGKTLLAKAVAGEAGVPFYSISGSDFVEMYVGVGASRVRDLFDTARKNPAAIIFIDEIDAVGRHRGAGLGGGHDEREQTLNQLLVEMDGFGTNEGVIVIAATNRPDILDPALLRPGRFDRQITVNYPDLKGREEILRVHAKNKPFEEDVDLKKIAQTTVGFTGADLSNLLNEAALLAARKGKALIGMNDIEEASTKIIVGMPKKNHNIKPEEKKKTAYHEAGHAIIAHVLPSLDPVRQISIIPSGRALGYTLTPPTEDKYSVYKNGLKDEICELLGGRVAEKIIFDDISGGASNDIERATAIAKNMVMKLGMSDELGPILYGSQHSNDEVFLGRDFNNTKNYSEETAAKIDSEIKKIILEAYARTEEILRANIEKLHFIAEFLVRNEVMEQAQFERAMDTDVSVEELEEMVAEKRRRSEEENRIRAERIKAEEAKREAERAAEEAKRERIGRDMMNQNMNFADYLNNIERDKQENKSDSPFGNDSFENKNDDDSEDNE
ncbi:MAG: ATP-dependent zinc metalloprotease FtsH [Clostridia bacterium]|nr:ATP-dependent zinc metalloprotease FtsH [Clostridia bacterium]